MEAPADSPPPAVSPAAVKRALRALACEASPDGGTPAEAAQSIRPARLQSLIDTARYAMNDVDTAAAFVADGGLPRLRQAVAIARQHGHPDLARDGTEVLATVARFRRAARGEDSPASHAPGDGENPPTDYFHSGRGTVLGPNGKGTDR